MNQASNGVNQTTKSSRAQTYSQGFLDRVIKAGKEELDHAGISMLTTNISFCEAQCILCLSHANEIPKA